MTANDKRKRFCDLEGVEAARAVCGAPTTSDSTPYGWSCQRDGRGNIDGRCWQHTKATPRGSREKETEMTTYTVRCYRRVEVPADIEIEAATPQEAFDLAHERMGAKGFAGWREDEPEVEQLVSNIRSRHECGEEWDVDDEGNLYAGGAA